MTTTPDDDDEIDLLALVATLWRGKWIIAACTLVAIAIGGYYALRVAVPLFPATATIALNDSEQRVITDIESLMGGGGMDNSSVNTELEVLRSRALIGRLVDQLNLVDDPEFNGRLREPSGPARLRAIVSELLGGAAEEDTVADRTVSDRSVRNNVINAVLGVIQVSNLRNTMAINVSATTTDPEKSARIANTLVDIYIDNQIQVKLDALSNATEFLSERTVELRQNLEELETDLAEFTDQSELVSREALEAQTLQLRELRSRVSDARSDVAAKQERLERLHGLWQEGDVAAFVEEAEEFRLNRALTQFRDGVITREDLERDIERFLVELQASAARDIGQLQSLERSEQDLSEQIARQSEELFQLQQLERETEAARLLYESFFTRLQEMNVQRGLEAVDSRILSEAIPRPASSPRKARILALSMILGAVLGSGLVLLREMRFAGFRTSDDLRAHTSQRVLASVPLIPEKDRKKTIAYLREKPNSVVAEAVRNLRTSILMTNIDHPPQVIMLTSSVQGEGKTTLALSLANNMVGMGKKVLLVEADIRRRTLGEYLGSDETVALLDLLTDKVTLEEADPFVEEFGFDVLRGTRSEVNAADLFSSERFTKLLKDLRQRYDYILIDTPPVLAVTDARIIGALADSIVYAVKWNQTTRTQLRQGLEMLEEVGKPIAGLVLNQVNPGKLRGYGYGGQYGYDTYGYGRHGSGYYDT